MWWGVTVSLQTAAWELINIWRTCSCACKQWRSLGTWFGNRRVATSKPQYGECCGGLCLPPTHSYAPWARHQTPNCLRSTAMCRPQHLSVFLCKCKLYKTGKTLISSPWGINKVFLNSEPVLIQSHVWHLENIRMIFFPLSLPINRQQGEEKREPRQQRQQHTGCLVSIDWGRICEISSRGLGSWTTVQPHPGWTPGARTRAPS